MQPDEALRVLEHVGQLSERDARGVGRQQRALLHLRFDLGVDLLLEFDLLRHRLDHQVGVGDAVLARVGDQAIEDVAGLRRRAVLALAQLRRPGHRLAERFAVGVEQGHPQAAVGAPGGDVAAHRPRSDHVHVGDVAVGVLGDALHLLAHEKHPQQALGGVGGEQLGEGVDLVPAHALGVAAVFLPQLDQRLGGGVVLGRRLLGALVAHLPCLELARGLRAEQAVLECSAAPLDLALDRRGHRG